MKSLSVHGGLDEDNMATRAVNFLLETGFQTNFTWLGRREKTAFRAVLGPIVKGTVFLMCLNTSISKCRIIQVISKQRKKGFD